MISVPLPERFSLNIFRSKPCPFGTQLNEFSRVFHSFQFQKDPEIVYLRMLQRKKGNMPLKSYQENRLGENDKKYEDSMCEMTESLQNLIGNGFAL